MIMREACTRAYPLSLHWQIASKVFVLVAYATVSCDGVFMPPPSQTGWRRHYVLDLSVRSSVCSFVCCQTREHDILKISEPIL